MLNKTPAQQHHRSHHSLPLLKGMLWIGWLAIAINIWLITQ